MPLIDGENYLYRHEAAERLGLHPNTLLNQRSDRREAIPARKLGSTLFYREKDVDAYVERHGRR